MDILIANSRDWIETFYPAIQAFLRDGSPHIFNAPWAIFPLIPFAVFPFGRELLFVVSLCSLAYVAYRLGAPPLGMIAFLLSPFVFDSLLFGNVEWLALLGLVINPAWGLILLFIKPQVTAAIMAFLVVESFRNGGIRSVVRLVMPLAIALTASFAVFGLWTSNTASYLNYQGSAYNTSLFPWSVPLGVVLFVLALRTHNIRYAIAASPFFFPVITLQCWMIIYLALVSSVPRMSLASAGSWVVMAFVRLQLG